MFYERNSKKLKTVYLLGAGFTKGIINENKFNPPLLKDLTNIVVQKLLERYEAYLKELVIPFFNKDITNIENIELILTYIDVLIEILPDEQKEILKNIRSYTVKSIIEEIKKITPQSLEDYKKDVADEFVRLLNKGDIIISFNYDTVLENLLWLNKVWSPFGGYFNDSEFVFTSSSQHHLNKKLMDINIIKLHGSINFLKSRYYNPTGKEINFQYDCWIGTKINEETFPEIHADFSVADGEGEYLVVPSYIKKFGGNYYILFLWQKAYEALAESFRIIIIGYSFPDGDELSRMLFSFIRYDNGPSLEVVKRRIFIVSPEAETIWKKIRRYIPISDSYINKVIISDKLENKIKELKEKLELL